MPSKNKNTIIYHPELSNISKEALIGDNCKIHSHVWIGAKVKIGNNCKIEAFAFIPDGVTIEDNVFIGPHVCFTNDKHPPSGGKDWQPIFVKRGARIGAGAVILPGVTIGENAMIGAGAVVTKDVPSNITVIGNPARPL
jgi:UDP-2-acetamido-3-amino-2,3-dideoxy-glucuronate N-acetyltransferase